MRHRQDSQEAWRPLLTREEIIEAFPLEDVLKSDGVALIGSGPRRMALCRFHKEKTPSFSVNLDKGVFYCFGCQLGGSVIDYIAQRDGKSPETVMRELSEQVRGRPKTSDTGPAENVIATYVYQNALGEDLFRVLRYEPKTFKQQRRIKGVDAWAWGMDGVERVPYQLPEILAAGVETPVIITEGEKDVETLRAMGFVATTNVGGAGKWLEGYNEFFRGRDVIVCGDNDKADASKKVGADHVKLICETLDGVARRLRVVKIPEPDKDVSDWRLRFGSADAAKAGFLQLLEKAVVLVAGGTVPILSMAEMEDRYRDFLKVIETRSYTFTGWLPTFGRRLRPNVPGDIICFAAATGVGKTAILQNMAWRAAPLPVLLFEMELSDSVTFERFVASAMDMSQWDVEAQYKGDYVPDWRETKRLDSIYVCPLSGLTVGQMETIINRSELKMGVRPLLVMVDYVQLIKGQGKGRYEKTTDIATDLKSLAKNTGTIIVLASQVGRPGKDKAGKVEFGQEVGLNDAKDSGQIENSSALHIGCWKESDNEIMLRVNKQTRGYPGLRLPCNWNGPKMLITEKVRTTAPGEA